MYTFEYRDFSNDEWSFPNPDKNLLAVQTYLLPEKHLGIYNARNTSRDTRHLFWADGGGVSGTQEDSKRVRRFPVQGMKVK
jgi:hypothetical protein